MKLLYPKRRPHQVTRVLTHSFSHYFSEYPNYMIRKVVTDVDIVLGYPSPTLVYPIGTAYSVDLTIHDLCENRRTE